MKYSILVVDDEINNTQLLMRTLRRKYTVHMANSPYEALEILQNNNIDLILSDQMMPEMKGVEFLSKARNIAPDTIRILITGYTDANALITAINEGKIYRYIKKPWIPEDLLNVVDSALEVYQLNIDNNDLAFSLKELFSGTISAITEALDAKDSYTFGRSKRVSFYAVETAKHAGLSMQQIKEVELAGLLHDIGMIGVSESILNKPENLTGDEYSVIKTHVNLGVKILEEIKQLGGVINIVKSHHERFDGTGYPNGLKGEEIPIGARIIAIADAYDGITSDRPYRKGMPHEFAIEEINKSSGTQFDPEIVKAFFEIIDKAKVDFEKSIAENES